ncbi:MAG: fibronectin type III domain-containing protein, partial [Anaerolineae bacterium]
MRRTIFRLTLICAAGLILLSGALHPTAAQETPPICFWSDHGPVTVRRTLPATPRDLLTALLTGPTAVEQAQGIWSAIPTGTTLNSIEISTDRAVTVRLALPPAALLELDHERFEVIVHQIGWTLEPLAWRELHIETWDAAGERFVPLADSLPPIPPPRKETLPADADGGTLTRSTVGHPPGSGQGQPQGALTGKTVYVSAGHGWLWNSTLADWRVQRIPYPRPPYVGPIIEDFNNAEVVNQYLLQYLWNAGATVIPVRERDMHAVERIVNNDDATGYVEEGAWETSTFAGYDPNVWDHTYRYTATVAGRATSTATWTTTMPEDGRYAVYVWYRHGPNRPLDARYTVHHAGGETTVTVNQRHHGSTWHYIGTYGFQAGQPARVTLTNESSAAGQAVIADAVRIGGGTFDSLVGIDTAAHYPANEPWWDVAAFYYTQRMGMDAAPGDVTARPIYARWEHAGTDEDAVYVSWHTNGVSGYQWDSRGTISIIHNGDGNPVTPRSEQLRSAIHNELLNDIRAAWDPSWPGSVRQMNLGELRELWDPDPDVALPGVLLEIAYHDHPADTDALKEPSFGILTARAVYQGILKYFDPNAAQLPEPPTHLSARNLGNGEVQLDWHPSPTDANDVVGDAATGYRVYTSANGVGWSDGVPVNDTTHTLTGLTPGQLLFVRVSATNAGGESFPTETLVVRVGDVADVLLVNGFDRLNRTMSVPDIYEPSGETHLRMLLDYMNRYDYVIQHGQVISYAFDSASNEAVIAGNVSLGDYGLVDWILGEESTDDETLDATEQTLLSSFLSGGGSLLITGSEIGWDLDGTGSPDDRNFYQGTLRAVYAGDDAGTYEVAPAPGSIFDGLSAFRFDDPVAYNADYPDRLTPVNGSVAALTYQGGAGGTAAIQYQNGCQRLVYLGFPFETVQAAHQPTVMARAIDFLDECTIQPPRTVITSP